VEDVGFRQELVGVDGATVQMDFVVQVGGRDASGSAYGADQLAAADFLAGMHVHLGEMGVEGFDAAVIDHHHEAVAALAVGEADDAIGGDVNGRADGRAEIDAFVEFAFLRERIAAMAEAAQQPAIDGPEVGSAIERVDAAR